MSLRHGGPHFTNAPPSLEAANQAQIDDLVQRNRTLEHTIKKLNEQVALEQARTRDAVTEIQSKWEANQLLWKEGCEAVLSSYRIVQKKLEIEVETERAAIIKEMAITREEKLQRIQRDVKIKRFQMREQELENRIEELEEEKASLTEAVELELQEEKERSAQLASKLKEIRESSKLQLIEVRSALQLAKQERDNKEAELGELAGKHADLESKLDALETKLSRTRLQLEGSQTKVSEVERLNDELKRANASLTSQLERWQSLESKGGEAAEQQRKQIVTLELKLREVEEIRQEESEKAEEDLEKAQRRLQKVKDSLAKWETQADNQTQEINESNKQLAKLQKANDKLKADLEEERARVRPPTPQKARKETSPPAEVDSEVDDIEEVEALDEPVVPRKKSSSKATTTKPGPSRLAEEPEKPAKTFKQIAKKSTGSKPPRRRKASTPVEQEVVEISDQEVEEPVPTTKRKAKAKAVEPEDIEEEDVTVPRNRKGKRKASENDDSDVPEIIEKPRSSKRGSRAPSEVRDTTIVKAKGKRTGSKQPVAQTEPDHDADEDDQTIPKKKKRKIIAPITSGGPFAFGTLSLAQFDDHGFNIPSTLSPLKQDERVPQRSTSSNLVSSLGSLVKNSISGMRKP